MKIRAISLWRPWADWVLLGWKTVETRTHQRFRGLEGERIAICASKKWDLCAIPSAREFLTPEQIYQTEQRRALPIGGHAICTALVSTHVSRLEPLMERCALIECQSERSGLLLANLAHLKPTVPVIGRQGIFSVDLPLSSLSVSLEQVTETNTFIDWPVEELGKGHYPEVYAGDTRVACVGQSVQRIVEPPQVWRLYKLTGGEEMGLAFEDDWMAKKTGVRRMDAAGLARLKQYTAR